MKQKAESEWILNSENIDAISAEISSFCKDSGMDSASVTRHRLAAEECLLDWMGNAAGEKVTLSIGKRLGKAYYKLDLAGPSFNPFQESESHSAYGDSILSATGIMPEYSYSSGHNTLTFWANKKKSSPIAIYAIVIAISIILANIIKILIPENIVSVILNEYLNPIYDMLFRCLGCISGPLILLSVMWGVYGIGDTILLGKVGKKLITHFVLLVFLITLIGSSLFPFFNNISDITKSGTSAFSSIFSMILDIVPSNILSPLTSGNTLQIIFCAVMTGIAMLFLDKKVAAVAQLIEQINYIVQFLMELISKMIPAIIFVIVLQMILSDTFLILKSIWRFAVVYLGSVIFLSLCNSLFISIKFNISPISIWKKCLSTFIITITTASSAAAFGSIINTCEKKLGIYSSFCSFGVPLGMVMFKPATALYYLLISFYFARIYSIDCSLSWIITAVFISALLSIATPPIPGGGAAAYAIILTQLAIPAEALAVAVSIDILFDFVMTSVDMFNLPLVLTDISSQLGILSPEKMHKK